MHLTLDPWQKEFLATKGDKLLCTGRQVGKSVICGMDAGRWAIANANKVVLMIAPTERQAYALFEKTLAYIYENARKLIKKGRSRPTKSRISLTNGTIIWCLPTGLSGLGIRFLTVHRLYADEASRITLAVWDAVTPMLLTTGGDTILLSTPFGTDGYFYDALINKEDAFSSFTRFRTDSRTVMADRSICVTWTTLQRDKALQRLDQEKSRMTALAYAQEYMGQPLNALKQVFPDKLLQEVMTLSRVPLRTNRRYFLGQDIAGMGKDTSTWEILDATNNKVITHCENITKTRMRTPDRVKLTLGLDRAYHFQKIGLDDGGLGSGDYDYLLTNNTVKRKVVALNNASRPLLHDGTRQKRLLKEDMYNNLIVMLEMGKLRLLNDDNIYHSLRSIQFETTNGKTRYSGTDSHIAEGLIRAAWLAKEKYINLFYYSN